MTKLYARFGAITGLGVTVLVFVAFAVSSPPPSVAAGGAPVVRFYTSHSGAAHTSDTLWIIAFGVFVFFAGFLRDVLKQAPQAEGLATVGLAGAALTAAGVTVYFGCDFALASMPASIAPAAAQAVNLLALQLFLPVAVGVVVFALAFGIAIISAPTLPTWAGWVAFLVALSAPAGPFALVGLALWSGVVGVIATRRANAGIVAPAMGEPAPAG